MKNPKFLLALFAFTVSAFGAIGAKLFVSPTAPFYSFSGTICQTTNIAGTCTLTFKNTVCTSVSGATLYDSRSSSTVCTAPAYRK